MDSFEIQMNINETNGFPQRRKDAKALSNELSLRTSLRLCALAGTWFLP
jgi:hypothetical protein